MTSPSFELGVLDSAAGALPFVRRGPLDGPQLLIVQPLFEEQNRLRRLLADVGRRLAEDGVGSWMVDLPGTGDSDIAIADARWDGWRSAMSAAADHIRLTTSQTLHALSVRGGALLDDVDAVSTYRLAPTIGERLLRDLLRAQAASGDSETMASLTAAIDAGQPVHLAGYALSGALAQALRAAAPPDNVPNLRTATVGEGSADISLPGAPLWRQAEPLPSPELAAALAEDVASWINTCAAR